MNKGGWGKLVLFGLLLGILGGGLVLGTLRSGPAPALPPEGSRLSATVVNDEQPLPAFSLTRAGSLLTNADLLGHWSLVFFGYTHCPDVCLTSLAAMKDMRDRLQVAGVVPPQVIFVSVDAARDTPAHLAEFVSFFDPSFIGATGKDAALAPLVKNLGVFYQRQDSKKKDSYTMDHTSSVFLVDPKGRLKAVFSWPHDPQAMAVDYPKIIAY
jgi:protein SCO1/2